MNMGKMYFDFGYVKKNFNIPNDALFKCFNINEVDESVEIVFYTNEISDNYKLANKCGSNLEQIPRVILETKNKEEAKYFKERDLKDVIKIICDQNLFNELVDFPYITMKNNTYCYKGIPIFIDDNLKYKTYELIYKSNDNFYDGIVNNLKQEAKHLNDRLTKFRNNNEMNGYIATLKSLRETLDLIKKYDWNLMYSEYGVENDKIKNIEDSINIMLANGITTNNEGKDIHDLKNDKNNLPRLVTEISVWEQNHDGQIRNHNVWRTSIPYKKFITVSKDGLDICKLTCDNIILNEEVKHLKGIRNMEKEFNEYEYKKVIDDKLKSL